MALGGPGVVALRALSRVTGGPSALTDEAVRDGAARVAWGLRSLFNLPEVTALVRRPKAYWKAVLDYCVAGCLQAVLDEYAHVLVEWLGLVDREPAEVAGRRSRDDARLDCASHGDLRGARLRLRTERTSSFGSGAFRARFALRFGDNRIDEERDSHRPTLVREAFNSPFWPFVLATTSVGQEGLDFHLYCHAVVHWNLPANPVDLEQREGRVHRYKGHAIRKNLAAAYPRAASRRRTAIRGRRSSRRVPGTASANENDLVPSWIFARSSEDRAARSDPSVQPRRSRLAALKRSLAAYRLAFGQPRQEDLIAFLERSLGDDEVARSPRSSVSTSPHADASRAVVRN